MSIFISHHAQASSDVARLTAALQTLGLSCTGSAAEAATILLYISPAYIAPHSPTITEAAHFLNQKSKLINVIAIFASLSVPEVKHQAEAPGWDPAGTLKKLRSNMGIDMKHRKLTLEQVAKIVKDQMTVSPNSFDIFLSHAGEDKGFIRVLNEVLGKAGYRCFLDEESLKPGNGVAGDEQLVAAAKAARLGLFVLSDRSIKKWWPLKEVSIFQNMRTRIVIVWYQFLKEQAEQYVRNPPPDLLQYPGAKEFLQNTVLGDPSVMSIWYQGAAWNNPNKEEYALHIKDKIQAIIRP